MAAATSSTLRVNDLAVAYRQGSRTVHVLRNLSFDARENELVVVRGVSGSGKTSLLSCIAGILTPESGTIDAAGQRVTSLSGRALRDYRRRHVGIVFQAFNLVASLTALENVSVPLLLDGMPYRRACSRALGLLERFGLHDRINHRPGALSGGERQRVAVARALVRDPAVLLADEPTSNLDRHTAESMIDLLQAMRSPNRVVLIATHDDRLLPLADRTVELGDGPPDAERQGLAGQS